MSKTRVTIELSADTARILTAEAKTAGWTLKKTIELRLALWARGEEVKHNQPEGTLPLTDEEQIEECVGRDRR